MKPGRITGSACRTSTSSPVIIAAPCMRWRCISCAKRSARSANSVRRAPAVEARRLMALNIVIENVLRAPDKQQPMSIAITLEWPRYRADAISLAWRATLLMLVILLLGACSSLPSQGPAPGAAPPTASAGPPGANANHAIHLDAISDAIPRIEPRSRYGNPPYYEVSGRRYYVRASSDDYVERGIATWYGNNFHGRRTSCGEPYDMYSMTAAHATLPFPTYVEVTNLRNNR